MRDTPDEIIQLQRQIMHRMAPEQRAKAGLDMIDSAHRIVANSIRLQFPQANEAEVREQIFRRYYGHELPSAELEQCAHALRYYWEQRMKSSS